MNIIVNKNQLSDYIIIDDETVMISEKYAEHLLNTLPDREEDS